MFKSTTLSSANIADAITATIGYDQQILRSWLMIERGYDSTITPSLHLDENNEIFATL